MKKLSAVQSQIRSLQRQIAEGTYKQGKLTKVVNKLNELKSIEYKLINQRNEN